MRANGVTNGFAYPDPHLIWNGAPLGIVRNGTFEAIRWNNEMLRHLINMAESEIGPLRSHAMKIARLAAREFGCEFKEILSRTQRGPASEARHVTIVLLHELHPDEPDRTLSAAMGRDRSLFSWARKRVRDLSDVDPLYRSKVAKVRAKIRAQLFPNLK